MNISNHCNENRPCNICGKDSSCKWVKYSNGDIFELCGRVSGEVGDKITGIDGNKYIFRKKISETCFIWETIAQCEQNAEEFKEMIKTKYKLKKQDNSL